MHHKSWKAEKLTNIEITKIIIHLWKNTLNVNLREFIICLWTIIQSNNQTIEAVQLAKQQTKY